MPTHLSLSKAAVIFAAGINYLYILLTFFFKWPKKNLLPFFEHLFKHVLGLFASLEGGAQLALSFLLSLDLSTSSNTCSRC